ncbi:hypothetical protein SAMN04488552_0251 [Christiangramia echinicola]|uniref:Uncharacterized protein n=1 Tax=Christiangramia echinicola TaxID=279359 RepID=A0A1H1KUX2_9FLAO|nr:hypothetical protein SAMN04488552_0251 [Christiangramia echinicola]
MEEYSFLLGILILLISSILLYYRIKEYQKIKKDDHTLKYYNVKITGSLILFWLLSIYLIFK